MNAAEIARVVHEANRALQVIQGDPAPSLEWDQALPSDRDSCIDGVKNVLAGNVNAARESHENWMRYKLADGWIWGEEKSWEAKTHPCLVEYDSLPPAQRDKDKLFVAIVRALDNGERETRDAG